MSHLTLEVNQNAELIMKNMEIYSKQQELTKMGNDLHLEKVDFPELIRKAGIEIKALNYRASKITNSESKGNAGGGKELKLGLLQEIDAIPEEYIYLKARISGLKDPLKFNILWGPNVPLRVRADLKIYLSLTCKEPDYHNNSQVIHKVRLIEIYKAIVQKKSFMFRRKDPKWNDEKFSEFLYMSFQSIGGCTFQMSYAPYVEAA